MEKKLAASLGRIGIVGTLLAGLTLAGCSSADTVSLFAAADEARDSLGDVEVVTPEVIEPEGGFDFDDDDVADNDNDSGNWSTGDDDDSGDDSGISSYGSGSDEDCAVISKELSTAWAARRDLHSGSSDDPSKYASVYSDLESALKKASSGVSDADLRDDLEDAAESANEVATSAKSAQSFNDFVLSDGYISTLDIASLQLDLTMACPGALS